MVLASLPRRDGDSRARLEAVGRLARPLVGARERLVPVLGELGTLLPMGGLQRGVTIAVEGRAGAGATSLAFALAAAATATGEWAGAIDLDGTLGGEAAAAAGVALDRFAVVRRVPPARWATVVAALLDGVALVIAEVPRHVHPGDARRLVARARERGTVLVVLPIARGAHWPADVALRLHADGGPWPGLGMGEGLLGDRSLRLHVEGQGEAARPRHGVLARAAG